MNYNTNIRSNGQLRDGSVSNVHINESAAIALSKLAEIVIKADGQIPFSGNQSMGGNRLTNVGAPVLTNDAANKNYVIESLKAHKVAAVCDSNLENLEGLPVVDGYQLQPGNLLLLVNQTNKVENGIWQVSATNWVRNDILSAGSNAAGTFVFITHGAKYKNAGFICTSLPGSDVVGVNDLTFRQFVTKELGVFYDTLKVYTSNEFKVINTDESNAVTISHDQLAGFIKTISGNLSIIAENGNANVGINNSDPMFSLDVNGDLNFSGALRKNGVDIGNSFKDSNMAEYEARSLLPFYNIFSKIVKNGSNNQVIVPAFRVNLNGTGYYKSASTTLGVGDIDTGESFVFGTDYYVWAGVPASGHEPVLKLSVSPSSPTGLTSPKLIGGFHYGKIRNSITTTDVSDGIVPNSCWDLNHMPKCYQLGLADPANYQLGGMVEVIPGSLWVDIYLASAGVGTGFNRKVQSKINVLPLSGIEGLCWFDFVQRGKNSGKRLLTYQEFCAAAIGSPMGRNEDNLHGWTRMSNGARVKTGATVSGDADANYILGYNTSLHNVRDCAGNLWEWLADMSNRHDSTLWGRHSVLDVGELSSDTDFGQAHLPNASGMVAWVAGGSWSAGVGAGSRAVRLDYVPYRVGVDVGARFACDSL